MLSPATTTAAQALRTTMETEVYKSFAIYGHAIAQDAGFAASGTIMRDDRLVQSSGILDVFLTEEEALLAGLAWAREWVDGHPGR
jgi:hypothetical protein